MNTCGQINYRRTYFKSKETGDFVHLADEDHVSLHFNKEKDDLKTGKNGRKINNVEAGLYKGSEGIWNDVLHYIDTVYDEEYLDRIYIMGDGAP